MFSPKGYALYSNPSRNWLVPIVKPKRFCFVQRGFRRRPHGGAGDSDPRAEFLVTGLSESKEGPDRLHHGAHLPPMA